MSHLKTCREYSRAEYISDAVVHGMGITGALVAGPLIVGLAASWTGDARLIAALSIYAVTLLSMWVCSALYNLAGREDLVSAFRRLDQSAIYFKIAGTYTPFIALASASGGFLAAIWSIALAGAAIIVFSRQSRIWLAIALYLTLGWAGTFMGGPLLSGLSLMAFWFLVAGGLLYTGGIVFLMSQRIPFHNTIWHVFVLIATISCYAAIVTEVARAG